MTRSMIHSPQGEIPRYPTTNKDENRIHSIQVNADVERMRMGKRLWSLISGQYRGHLQK